MRGLLELVQGTLKCCTTIQLETCMVRSSQRVALRLLLIMCVEQQVSHSQEDTLESSYVIPGPASCSVNRTTHQHWGAPQEWQPLASHMES
jgi:hypothetical protein